ncbi:MAG: phospho-2-dehydro-3-deoxyheptonate aldolase [Nitrospirales bacterium]|nr:MAG: phospho-2-dehydro-3-deoxyheptonate aldolase [Nitrospirales bacterium]
MTERIDNRNIIDIGTLMTPREVKKKLPLPESTEILVRQTRQAIQAILNGHDRHRLLVIVGPCSIHDPQAAYEYAERLKGLVEKTQEHLVIVMRTYFEKPRTTVGWKGLINDPHLDTSCDIDAGFQLARNILLNINEMGIPCGTEFLDPVTPQYLSDLISWSAIGARTTESQTHREMASGLSMPVGFKNGTDGGLQVALNAMIAARHPQSFIGINVDGVTSIIKTNGNQDRHIVLRGGGGKVNYQAADIEQAAAALKNEKIQRPIMVDCSHGNSEKDHTRQTNVARNVLQQICLGQEAIMGLLIESHLNPGNQKWEKGKKLAYGVSITDACLGWNETETLIHELQEGLERASKENTVSL